MWGQRRETLGLLQRTKGLVWGDSHTLRRNRTQLVEKHTDLALPPPPQERLLISANENIGCPPKF